MENKKSKNSTSTTYSQNSSNNTQIIKNSKENMENCDDDEFYLQIDEDSIRRKSYDIRYESPKQANKTKKNIKIQHKNLSSPSVPKVPLLKRNSSPTPIKLTPTPKSSKYTIYNFVEDDILIEKDILTDKESIESDNSESDSSSSDEKSISDIPKRCSSMDLIDEDVEKSGNEINDISKKLDYSNEDGNFFNIKMIKKEMNRSKKLFLKNDYKDSFNKIDFVIKENYLKFKKMVLTNEKNKKTENTKDNKKNNKGKNKPILNMLRKNSKF